MKFSVLELIDFSSFLSSYWFLLLALVLGATHAAHAQSKLLQLDKELEDVKSLSKRLDQLSDAIKEMKK